MGNHISFVRGISGAIAALALLLAGCASRPAPEPAGEPREATPVSPVETEAYGEEPYGEPAIVEEEGAGDARAEAPVADDKVRLREDAPLRYVVKKGDTLWDISGYYLKDPWQWPELWYANPQVENPHLIYPGDELLLVYVDGVPRLARGPDAARIEERAPVIAPPPGGTDKLAPAVRDLPLEAAIHTIPLESIRAFLRSPRIVSEDALDDAPYVVDFDEKRLIAGADTVAYVLDLKDRSVVKHQIIRKGKEYRDPDDGDLIGYEAIPVADSEVRAYGDPATIYLTRSDIETRAGDYLLPLDDFPLNTRFVPRPPERKVNGTIISVYNGVSQIGQFHVVAINRGSQHGLEPGHVLSIVQTGRVSKDPRSWYGRRVQLPDVVAGTVMVFKTDTRLSYALVMDATRAVHLYDRVEKPGPSQ